MLFFQTTGPAVTVTCTTSVGTSATMQVGVLSAIEIVNQSTTGSAAFVFTPQIIAPSGITQAAAATAATTANRTIPPDSVVYEYVPAGTSFVSAIGITSSNVAVTFTPGQIKAIS